MCPCFLPSCSFLRARLQDARHARLSFEMWSSKAAAAIDPQSLSSMRRSLLLAVPPLHCPLSPPSASPARRVYLLSGYVIARLSHLVRLPFFLHVRPVPLRIYLLSFTTGATPNTDPVPVQL